MIIYKNIGRYDVDPENKILLTNFILKCKLTNQALFNELQEENLIMTLNYDLLIENRFRDNQSPLCGQKIDYSVGLNPYPPKLQQGWTPVQVEILKLHGSFNWFRAKGSKTNDINSIYIVNKDDDFYTIHRNDVPVYIPMAHSKESFLNGTLFNTIWAKATHYLELADEIFFIGYGFPKTDINNLNYFLGFKEKIICVVVYEESDALARLKGLFGNHVVQNIDAKDFLMKYLELNKTSCTS